MPKNSITTRKLQGGEEAGGDTKRERGTENSSSHATLARARARTTELREVSGELHAHCAPAVAVDRLREDRGRREKESENVCICNVYVCVRVADTIVYSPSFYN